MIDWMQKNRKFLVPTLWISAIAFIGSGAVGWGAYKYGNAGGDKIAKVGDRYITNSDMQSTLNNLYSYYNSVFQGKFTKEMANQMHLQEQAFAKLIDDNILLNYADELGITALDDEVIKEFTSIKAFWVDGKFSKSRLEQILRSKGINKKQFEEEVKKGIILRKLTNLLKMKATPLEKEALYAGKNLKKDIVIKKLTLDPQSVSLNDEEIQKFWQNHKESYKSKLSYTIEAIRVLAKDIDVDDKSLEEFYQKNRLQFKNSDGKIKKFEDVKEDVKKAYALKKIKKAALKKYLELKKGKIKADETITVDADNAPFDLSKISSLKQGDYIKAVALKDGYLTGKIVSINKPKALPFEKAKVLAKADLAKEKGMKELRQKANTLAKNGIEDGVELGFLTISQLQKSDKLNPQESNALAQAIFTNENESGTASTKSSVIAYKIKAQKLLDSDGLKKEDAVLSKNIADLKRDSVQKGLIKQLKNRYEIKQLVQLSKKEG
ncbi:MAG: hypothetical protein DSZ06_03575 [Sulfurospirillum sp.]|nr:MAG: hypothetical protein DSZ06_03575 [Sulfurospirillum sp.]